MSAASARPPTSPLVRLDPPAPPGWVAEVLGEDAKEGTWVEGSDSLLRIDESPRFCFVSLVVPEAEALADDAFRDSVRRAYRLLCRAIDERGDHQLRIWNYVPGIARAVAGGSSRYELFNAGRYQGYGEVFGGRDFSHLFCAATAVDHRGRDLVFQVLAGRAECTPVENPRQRPAYRYSRRYGAVPPSFARMVRLDAPLRRVDGARSAILSGTASIVGEETRHPGDTAGQLGEVLQNLVHLSRSLAGESVPETDLELDGAAGQEALRRFTDLRAYVLRDDDAGEVLTTLERTLPGLRHLEIAAADLCRPEIRVEIEGLACLDS